MSVSEDSSDGAVVGSVIGLDEDVTGIQGFNTRKVISEVCASFVLQCTVSGR